MTAAERAVLTVANCPHLDERAACERCILDALLAHEAEVRAEMQAEVSDLRAQIEDGRCCDDFERLPACGHPRCVVSETCELCVEIGQREAEVREEMQLRLDAAAELFRYVRIAAGIEEPIDVAALPGIVENLRRELDDARLALFGREKERKG